MSVKIKMLVRKLDSHQGNGNVEMILLQKNCIYYTTFYNIHSLSVHCIMCNAYYSMYTVHSVHYAACTTQYILLQTRTMYASVHNSQCPIYNVHCT